MVTNANQDDGDDDDDEDDDYVVPKLFIVFEFTKQVCWFMLNSKRIQYKMVTFSLVATLYSISGLYASCIIRLFLERAKR